MLGRREFGVAVMADKSTQQIVKPSSPVCAAVLGAPLAMADVMRTRVLFYKHQLIDLSQGDPSEHTSNTCGVIAVPPGIGPACLLIKIR